MTGADLHPNAIDGTTGTELTPASQAAYDGRYVRTIGATITPTANGTATLKVTKQDGTTNVFNIDTSNARVGIGTNAPSSILYITGEASPTVTIDGTGGSRTGLSVAGVQKAEVGYGPTGYGFTHPTGAYIGTTASTSISFGSLSGSSPWVVVTSTGLAVGNTSANSALHVTGPIATAITTSPKTAAYTIAATDSTVLADASGGTFQITLPTAVGCAGRQYVIKRTGATNNVTVGGTSAQTFDGATTKTLGSQYATLMVQSDNANWQILATLGTIS